MKTIAITIDEGMLRRIDAIAVRQGQSEINRSQFIREAIRDRLARIERSAEEERERQIFRKNKVKLQQQALALIKEQAKP